MTCVTNESRPTGVSELWVKVPFLLLLWAKISSPYSKKLSSNFSSLLLADYV